MTIQEILEAHEIVWQSCGDYGETVWVECECSTANGDDAWTGDGESDHRAHVAEVLEQHMQEREACALESFVASQMQMLENMESIADEHDRDEVDRWCSVISNRAKEIRESTNGR